MACGCKKKEGMGSEQKTILAALSAMGDPCGSKEIAEKTGLEGKIVTNFLKSLKTQGLIDSPVRCKYAITEAGRAAL